MARLPDFNTQARSRAPLTAAAARQNMLHLIHLRWIAVFGQVVTIAVAQWGLGIRLPLLPMGAALAVLVVGNLLSMARLRRPVPITSRGLFFALAFDALVLMAQLYLSGGATNPFTSLFLLQVILAAVLLERWAVWSMTALTAACYAVLTFAYEPLQAPPGGPDLFRLYIAGIGVGFALNAVLLVISITRINSNLRLRDARLADLRQQSAEEHHIVRMGLLASGAAHELGTPLATMDVILGDWRRMPKLASDPELAHEIEEMRAELARCKAIVTGVLLSAGETRGEGAGVVSLRSYLAELFEEWRARRGPGRAAYDDQLKGDRRIVADSVLKQAVQNLLDNALEAAGDGVTLRSAAADDELIVTVQDTGPGFTDPMLADFGKPYHSTKGRDGGGLGLFLVVNVVRKLGGRIHAANRAGGGAEITIRLPLEALTVEAPA
jgi:two-component system sensor histidine kinase RegB